jgi:uncharacterized protein DUF4262
MTNDTEAQVLSFLDQQDAFARENFRRYGWTVQYVMGDEEECPPFGYTVGLFAFDQHPELVIFGRCPHDTGGVLNDVAGRVRRGRPVVPGELITFDNWPHRLHVLPLTNPAEVLFAANRFFHRPDHDSVPGLQLVWDDKDGRFPWEPGYSPPKWLQPLPGSFSA